MTTSLSLITLVDVAERRGSGSEGSPTSSSSSRNQHERTTCKISVTDTESGQSQVYTSRDSFQDAKATSAGEHRDFFILVHTDTYFVSVSSWHVTSLILLPWSSLGQEPRRAWEPKEE